MITDKKKKCSPICFLVPLASAIIYMVFCCLNLKSSIWFDESYSAYLVRGDFTKIWSLTAADVHPPFYYFLLKIWSSIFGSTDLSMRFMSVFFGALTIIVLFHLLRRWFGTRVASISTLLAALSPMLIRYGQEMRMYTLIFFIVILATIVLDLAIKTQKKRYYAIYAILVALGMWTHYFTALAWIVHVFYIVVIRRENLFQKKWVLTYLGAILLFVPWVPSFLSQVTEVQKGFWIPPVSAITPLEYLSQSLLFMTPETVNGWLVVLFLIVVFLASYLLRKTYQIDFNKDQKKSFLFLLSFIFVPPVFLIILSLPPLSPMFVDRYILYSAALIWPFIGLAFASFKKRPILKTVLLASVIASSVIGIINVENREPEGYVKDIVSEVDSLASEGEPILVNNEWTYYDAIFYSTNDHPIYCIDSWISYQYGSIFPLREYKYNIVDNINDIPLANSKLWFITDRIDDASSISDYELPEELEDYTINNEVSTHSHVAFELEKLSR